MSSAHRMSKHMIAVVLGLAGLMLAIWLWPSQAGAQPNQLQFGAPDQACVQPPANLAAWWPLEGNATDIRGGNNGVFNDSPAVGPGVVGNALTFDGVNDYISVPSS